MNIESLVIEQGRKPEETLAGYAADYLTSITAGQVRKFNYPIVKDNEPPNDPAHGLVLGKKSNSFASAMTRGHKWIVSPP